MKKLITMLSILTINIFATPLVIACKTKTTIIPGQNPPGKTELKIDLKSISLQDYFNSDLSFKVDTTKTYNDLNEQIIKAHVFNDIPLATGYQIKYYDTQNSMNEITNDNQQAGIIYVEIIADVNDEYWKGQTDKTPLTFWLNPSYQAVNLNEITADMIINWHDEYEYTTLNSDDSQKLTVKADKLGSLENQTIKSILITNLKEIISAKATKISKEKISAPLKNLNNMIILNDLEFISLHNFIFLIEYEWITINISSEENSKVFIATIKKDRINKCISELLLNVQYKKHIKLLLNEDPSSIEAIIASMHKIDKERETQKLKQTVDKTIKQWKLISQEINIDSAIKIYDHIKPDEITIKTDLNSN